MANLHKVDWREGVLDEADVQGADLSKADFRRAHMQDARMAGVGLREANLRGADLLDANGFDPRAGRPGRDRCADQVPRVF